MSIINKMIGQKQKNIEDSRTMMLYHMFIVRIINDELYFSSFYFLFSFHFYFTLFRFRVYYDSHGHTVTMESGRNF